jgi:hypothetical protein
MPAYSIDPQTGMPLLQTPGGGALPLPLSPEDMAAAGAEQSPAPPNWAPQVPEELRGLPPGAVAQNAGDGVFGPMQNGIDPSFFKKTPQQERAQLLDAVGAAPAAPVAHAASAAQPSKLQSYADRGIPTGPKPGSVSPSELAKPSGGGQSQSGGAGMDPAVEQVFREALQRQGGGGPQRLRVTGQTAKFFQPGEVPQEVSEEAERARQANEGYTLELADRADDRTQKVYEARQAEAGYRMSQIEVERTRQAEQQRMLDDYSAKRDTMVQQASALKAPEMEDYWGSKSDLAKMMTAVSIAIGGALQGLRGGSNPGLEMSNQAIDRWVASKREEYARAKDKADAADNQYAKMVQSFGSENLATANLREQAYSVRDAMLTDYAQQMGTVPAKDAAAQLLLTEQQRRAEGKAQAYAAAGKEIEEKLSLSGGGGGSPRLLKALQDASQAKEYLDKIQGKGAEPSREVQGEKVDKLTAAIDAIDAADSVQRSIGKLGYADRDADDPLSGAIDAVAAAVPGSDTRRTTQDLEQDTFRLARAAQVSLGKSDNDAALADRQAAGGGSGLQRVQAAERIRRRSLATVQDTLASMTPAQRNAFLQNLPPERRQQIEGALKSAARPTLAPSEEQVR